jgi:hypothetical protein
METREAEIQTRSRRGRHAIERVFEVATSAAVLLLCVVDSSHWSLLVGSMLDDSFPSGLRMAARILGLIGSLSLLVPRLAGYSALILLGPMSGLVVWRMGGGEPIPGVVVQLLVLVALARIARRRLAPRSRSGESAGTS